ncbi:phage integrase family protein [Mycobacteroides abscessus subsp. massiliense]|uniref:tyrosine-type recombinase/integrase n=1 Tax=Mycobacteroides abscessus TaxID=36809 RepID=UPI0009A8EC6C|nr:tyrosine-type recombinase/integrase [Mycobacteroides abscessus]SKK75309.1 phage integrase family protein [Mycobacteroides abscessus subsp. massiliense]SKL00637.1 phage integrase family protein [Mycobacteroides abscessus subsp. massiliense]SKM11146.1 phage integrase family protein [Mycobacteroides abscessus subsp. massiliense]
MTKALPALDLLALLDSWQLCLRAERKAEETVDGYGRGVRQFVAWCEAEGVEPAVDKQLVQRWVAELLAAGREAATVVSRQLAMKRFSAWLTAEGELDHDPLLGIARPKIDVKVVESLTDDELKAMIKACAGRELRDRRDEAILRLMVESGARASEIVGMKVADVDLTRLIAVIYRGKGGKGRIVPFGAQTAQAIDRYLRLRRGHVLADSSPALWLGERGKGFSYDGLYRTLKYRAEKAGVENFNPHKLRNTAATRWLARGGSEGGLMAVAGWSRRDMIDRYTAATASERAAAEARGLGLGDL